MGFCLRSLVLGPAWSPPRSAGSCPSCLRLCSTSAKADLPSCVLSLRRETFKRADQQGGTCENVRLWDQRLLGGLGCKNHGCWLQTVHGCKCAHVALEPAAFSLDSKRLPLRNQSWFTSVLRQKPLQSALGFLTQQSPPRMGLPSL